MRKVLLVAAIFGMIISMSDCDNDSAEKQEEEQGPFSLIGTWEAEGDFLNFSGKKFNYTCTLVFNESDYKETTHYKSEDSSTEFTARLEGSYTREEDVINGTWCEFFDNGGKTGVFDFSRPYEFTNKNTLKYSGLHPSTYTQNSIFKRKS